MLLIAEPEPHPIASLAIIAAAACVLIVLLRAMWQRVPYSPRRRVPWLAIDIVAVLALYLVLQAAAVDVARYVLHADRNNAALAEPAPKRPNVHVIGRLMSEGALPIIVLCIVSAAIVAPIAEEFFFRVLLQGWLERVSPQWRRQLRGLPPWLPRGLIPVLITSTVFAAMHYRSEPPTQSTGFLAALLIGDAVAKCCALVLSVGLLSWRTGATPADFGWQSATARCDVGLGLLSFAAIALPIYAMQISLYFLLGDCVAPDPIPLFFLAVALGVLYNRTHRFLPSVVLHAGLNTTSLLMAGFLT